METIRGKIFIASVKAVFIDPRLSVQDTEQGSLLLQPKALRPADHYVVHVLTKPMIFFWMTEDEARQAALEKIGDWLPKESGFSHYDVAMFEIPRSTFIHAQVFMTFWELWARILQVCGFRESTNG